MAQGISTLTYLLTVNCIRWLWQLNRCSTECGFTAHSRQTSAMPLVMRALYVFKSRQWPECNWASVIQTDWGSRLSSGEISGGEAPRTLSWVQNLFKLLLWLLGCGEYVDRSVCVDICDAFVWEWHNLSDITVRHVNPYCLSHSARSSNSPLMSHVTDHARCPSLSTLSR